VYTKTLELADFNFLFLFSTIRKLIYDVKKGIENIENYLNKLLQKFWTQKYIIDMTFARIFTFGEMQSLYTRHFKRQKL